MTVSAVNMEGKALFRINSVQQTERRKDFRHMPDDLALAPTAGLRLKRNCILCAFDLSCVLDGHYFVKTRGGQTRNIGSRLAPSGLKTRVGD
jgi:hypothetical protein